jgi:hypothetical protein
VRPSALAAEVVEREQRELEDRSTTEEQVAQAFPAALPALVSPTQAAEVGLEGQMAAQAAQAAAALAGRINRETLAA